jgi:chromatin segregation and condensation protein Rec8/ScpA/Scc1 (kleisin family)
MTVRSGSRSSVRFLAILELYREGQVELSQATVFGDIEVRWQGRAEAHR